MAAVAMCRSLLAAALFSGSPSGAIDPDLARSPERVGAGSLCRIAKFLVIRGSMTANAALKQPFSL
jgi:hypothetical protein